MANPIWPSSSAIPLCAIELLFRAASQRKRYCKTSNQLRLFDSITLNFKLSIYMEQKISKPQNYKCKQKLLVLIYSHAMLHVLTLSFDITQTKAIRCRTLSNCPKKQVKGNEFWFDTKITIFYGKQQIKLRRG